MLINIQLSQCTDVYLEFILITQIPCEFRIQAMNPLNHQQIILFQLFRSGTVLPFPGLKIKDWKIYFLSPEQSIHIRIELFNVDCLQTFKIIISLCILRRMLSVHKIIIYGNRVWS